MQITNGIPLTHFTPSPIEDRPLAAADASLIWGTEIDMTDLQNLIRVHNRRGRTLLTAMSVLVRLVGEALARHPQFNCRIFGRKIYRFNETNVIIPVQRQNRGPTL